MHNFRKFSTFKNKKLKRKTRGAHNLMWGDPGAAKLENRRSPHQNPLYRTTCCLASQYRQYNHKVMFGNLSNFCI